MGNEEADIHPYLVSIVVLAYNKLEYTRQCIESIYQYTPDSISYELIVVNNGSTDGTRDYFDSLPYAKPIHLEQNVGPVNGFNAGMEAAAGKYVACICNDFILTTNWLDNLLACIESDRNIGFVSPGANYISNYQQIRGDYRTLAEMQEFAKAYNVSDPRKWEERVRLLPCVLMVRRDILDEVGLFDPVFYFGEFADDDLSFRIRRAGYKLIFARDTFVYHFGSVTTGVEQRENNSLGISRGIFLQKYGIDVWADAIFDPFLVDTVSYEPKPEVRILAINPACGATPLQIKNKYREQGSGKVSITSITDKMTYYEDLQTVSDRVILGNVNFPKAALGAESFDVIFLGPHVEQFEHIEQLFADFKTMLRPGGQIICALSNASYHQTVADMLYPTVQTAELRQVFVNRVKFMQMLQQLGFEQIEATPFMAAGQVADAKADALIALSPAVDKYEAKVLLGTMRYLYRIR